MKAKRLTALALAALMAASTTSVALAGEKVSNDLDFAKDGKYYKYDPDDNRLEAVAKDSFQPGDDVYILLKDGAESFSSKKTYNAYGSWAIGESWVKDIDVVYRKGEVTTPGASVTKYTLNLSGSSLADFHGVEITGATSEEDALNKAKDLLNSDTTGKKANIILKLEQQYYTVGYKYKDTFYAKESDAVAAALADNQPSADLERVEKYYLVDGSKSVKDTTGYTKINTGINTGYVYLSNGAKGYVADLPTALKNTGYVEYTSGCGTAYYLTEGTELSDKGYGSITATNAGSLTALPESKKDGTGVQIWINTTTNKYNTANIANADVATATNNAVTLPGANDYYDSSNVVHTITEVNEPAYFYSDGTFYKKVSEVATTYDASKITEVKASKVGSTVTEGYTAATNQATLDYAAAVTGVNTTNITKSVVPGAPTTSTQYEYWVKISTKDSATTKDIDVVGTISVGTSKSSAEKDEKLSIDFTLTNANTDNDGYFDDVDSDITIEDGERAVVSFSDDAEDLIIEFGDDAWFEFNARGQGKLNLAYNTKFNRDFAYDYDHANIDFINFVAEPTTNKTGTLYIYADEDSYIYEVTSKGAKKINGAYYDDDEGAWVIRTRHLTSYAISDRRLKTIDQMEDDKNSSSSSKPSGSQGSGSGNGNYKPIPDTGR